MKVTASDIVTAIGHLPKNRAYHYINPRTKGQLEVVGITYPEGPIVIKRYNPSKGEASANAKNESISTQLIWRIANAMVPNHPINLDRVLGASYNTRSAMEALIAHTPQFYFCYPGRIEIISSSSEVKEGHKHLMWCPDNPHELGIIKEMKTDIVISEIPNMEVAYDALVMPDDILGGKIDIEIDIAVKRRHAQIQIALIMIGRQLNFRTWVAQGDKGILYKGQKIGEMDGVVASLKNENLINPFDGAFKAAAFIDCIWFKNGKLMPAVIEIEHSTGVTSGLTRMQRLQDALPRFPTRWVIVASDEDRERVFREANRPQFHSLDTKYFSYSAVEELYALCQRRKIRGVTEEFLDCYMESTITSKPALYSMN